MDGDIGLQIAVISSLSIVGLVGIGYYIRNYCKSKPVIKQSSSQTDLTSLDDPE